MTGTNRAEKLARQVQKDIGEILQKESLGFPRGSLVTVTKARMTNDLKIARLYFSIFPVEHAAIVHDLLQEKCNLIRFLLGNRLKNQVREIPELYFYVDDSLDYIQNIEDLLKE